MTDTALDEIIAKIHKIRNLAERGATQGEIDNATAILQKLMLQHGIDEAQLAIDRGDPLTGYGHREYREKSAAWKSTLINGICRGNGCKVIFKDKPYGERGHVTIFDVFGHRDQVRLVFALYHELVLTIEIACEMAWIKVLEGGGGGVKRNWTASWKRGAANALFYRFVREIEVVKTTTSGTALIVIENKVDEVVSKVYEKLRNVRATSTANLHRSAYSDGLAAGRNMNVGARKIANETRKLS